MSNLKQVPATCAVPHRAALESVRAALKSNLLERDDVVDGVLAAVLARQHVLLLGPPGTAKSQLINALTASIDGATSFSWLLTRFSTPDELFGPISLAALQQDRVERITKGKLPEAHVAFVDEIFKASSAILNSLLTLANERVFHNDGRAVPCPLIALIGASNELCEGNELEALFDRFLVRHWVGYVTEPRSVRTLLGSPSKATTATIMLADLETCQAETKMVSVPDAVIEAVIAVKQRTEEAGFRSSDRRWRQLVDLLKARAYLDGDDAVNEDHLEILADCLWREPKDRPALAGIIGSVANPTHVRATEIMDAAKEAIAKLGTVDAKDPAAKAEWMKAASLIESRLGDMEAELGALAQQNGNKNLRKVRDATAAIKSMKTDIARRVAGLYRL